MACYDGFGNLDDGRPIWIGNFWVWHGGTDILFYYPGDQNWWLGSIVNGQLTWSLVGNTAGFGQVADGRPFWVGDFNGTGGTDILFYYPGDQNWWLGSIVNGQLTWSLVGNTAGFGQVADGRPFWVGDFNGTGPLCQTRLRHRSEANPLLSRARQEPPRRDYDDDRHGVGRYGARWCRGLREGAAGRAAEAADLHRGVQGADPLRVRPAGIRARARRAAAPRRALLLSYRRLAQST